MRKKLTTFAIMLTIVSILLGIPAGVALADEKNNDRFSGDVSLLKEESDRYVFQVTAENAGEDFTGIVQVVFASIEGEDCAYNTPIVLPAQSKKQFTLSVPLRVVDTIRGLGAINFLDEKNKVVQTLMLRDILGSTLSGIPVGILSDDFSSLSYLDMGGENLWVKNLEYPVELLELNADNLGAYLDGLWYLIIDQFDVATLGKENIEAIQDWVKGGGYLIIGTGAYAEQTLGGFDQDFLDLQVVSIAEPGTDNQVTQNMAAYDYYYFYHESGIDLTKMAVAELAASGQNGYRESIDNPAMGIYIGQGSALVLYISLAEDEMQKASHDACYRLYSEVVDNAMNNSAYGIDMFDDMGRDMLAVIDHNSTDVDFTWLKVVIGIYVVIVGPVLYLILRKYKKSEWYWIAAPVLGFLFICGVFIFGQDIRVDGVRVYAVTTQRSGSDKINTHYEAYHSGTKEWRILLADNYDISGPEYNAPYTSTFTGKYRYMVQNDNDGMSVGLKPTDNFQNAYFMAEGRKETMGTLSAEHVQMDDISGTASGTFTNASSYDMAYMGVMTSHGLVIIEDVKAGETVDLAQAVKEDRCVYQQYASYYEELFYTINDTLRYNWTSIKLPDRVDKAELAALVMGFIEGERELIGQEEKVLLTGLVKSYPKTVTSKCKEQSYGCLYNVLDMEVENNAAN